MANKKMTVIAKYEAISAMLNNTYEGEWSKDEAVAFLQEKMEQTRKKNAGGTGEKKMTPEQEANEAIKTRIMEVLAANGAPMTLGDLMEQVDGIKSNQHISALVTQLRNAKLVVRSEVKGKAHYALPTNEAEE